MGVTTSRFIREDDGMGGGWHDIADRSRSFHVQAGVLGRFDTPLGAK